MPQRPGINSATSAPSSGARTRQLLVAVAGAWLLAAPFVLDAAGRARRNDLAIGAALLVISVFRVRSPRFSQAASWLVPGLGTWLAAAPLLLGYDSSAATINDVVVGLVVAVSGLWDAVATR